MNHIKKKKEKKKEEDERSKNEKRKYTPWIIQNQRCSGKST